MIQTDDRTPAVTPAQVRGRSRSTLATGETMDAELTDLIADVTAQAEVHLRERRIDPSDIVEVVAPAAEIVLAVWPVIEITSITQGATDLDWYFDEDRTITFPTTPEGGNLAITYKAGYSGAKLRAAAGTIKRAVLRNLANPSGATQVGGPGHPFTPAAIPNLLSEGDEKALNKTVDPWWIG